MRSFNSLVTSLAVLTVSAGLTSAQSISAGCQQGFAGVLVNKDAQCLNPSGLIAVVTAGQNSSLSGPVSNYLKGMCSQAACSNDTLSSVFTTLGNSCQAELGQLIGNISTAELVSLGQGAYPILRQVGCLEDTSNNTLCPVEDIQGMESLTGQPFTFNSLSQFVQSILASAAPNIPNNLKCTDCNKATLNVLKTAFPGLVGSDAEQNIQQTCGADFVNGQTPSDISQTASGSGSGSNNTTGNNNKNGALPLGVGSTGAFASVFLAVTSALVFIS